VSGVDWWANLFFKDVEDRRALRHPFLQAHRLAGNLLGSFLSWERWQAAAGTIATSDSWFPPPADFFHEIVREALERLGEEPNNSEHWILLSGVLGSLAPWADAAVDLANRLSELDFVKLYRSSPSKAPGILLWAARICHRLGKPAASVRLRAEILAAAEVLRKEVPDPLSFGVDATSPEGSWASLLVEAVRWASLEPDPARSGEQFAVLAGRLVNTWPETYFLVRQVVERLSRTVPLAQALRLRPLVLRLRAMPG
jgi:hypothetical protein